MNNTYIPDRGDIIWLTVDPSLGREQRGRRPALVLTNAYYNQYGLAYIAPITSKVKGYGIEVHIPQHQLTNGVVLTNQVFAADWNLREAELIETIEPDTLLEVSKKLSVILGL